MRRMRWTTCRDDRGQVAGIEVLPFGFLILVVGSLLLANAWSVVDAKMTATAAAREAARVYVESSDQATAHAGAVDAARSVVAGHGREAALTTVEIAVDGSFARCREVRAEVTIGVASVTLPFIGGFGRRFDVRASHVERIDPYRSGLAGEAICA